MVADTYGVLGVGDFVGGGDCLHPNKEGHTKIAAVFAETFAPGPAPDISKDES